MPRAKRVCAKPGCPKVTESRYCAEHWAEHEAKRGTTTQRGYGAKHQRQREQLSATVIDGKATCWRCGQPIKPGEAWDLGHDDNDRTKYKGPEHAYRCNRAAAGRASHDQPPPF